MDKIINVINPGNSVPSLGNNPNRFGESMYEMQRPDGNIYRLLESQYKAKEEKEKLLLVERSRGKLRRYARKEMRTDKPEYWKFIRYLSKNCRIGGFQAVKDKEELLRIDYFNATGEELGRDQYNADLNPETYGNAMRVYFPLPSNLSMDELNDLLPGDIEAKKWSDESNECCISRIPFVLELLSMGFRYGVNHKLDEIEKFIDKLSTCEKALELTLKH